MNEVAPGTPTSSGKPPTGAWTLPLSASLPLVQLAGRVNVCVTSPGDGQRRDLRVAADRDSDRIDLEYDVHIA